MTKARRYGANGAHHLQFLALQFSKYWRAQRRSTARVALGDHNELIEMIKLRQPWEPLVSHSLTVLLKLVTLGRAGQSQACVDL